jgi:NAD(P)H-dependent FMN reductase
VKILAISGSLRAKSSNTELLLLGARVAPDGITVTLAAPLDGLPHFNPDVETAGKSPMGVAGFRAELSAAAAVVICSPEYAHGVPGTLKNALDWVVGSGELVGKPVAVWNASARSSFAHESLVETLRTMSADVRPEACVTVEIGQARESVERMLRGALAKLTARAANGPGVSAR